MARVLLQFQHLMLLFLLFVTTSCAAAQPHGIAVMARRHHDSNHRLPFVIPRGGDSDLMDEISDTIHDSFMDVAITPWLQKHAVLLIKVRSCTWHGCVIVLVPQRHSLAHYRQSLLPSLLLRYWHTVVSLVIRVKG